MDNIATHRALWPTSLALIPYDGGIAAEYEDEYGNIKAETIETRCIANSSRVNYDSDYSEFALDTSALSEKKTFGTARNSPPVSEAFMSLDDDHQEPQSISLLTHNDNTEYHSSHYPPVMPPRQCILQREIQKASPDIAPNVSQAPFPFTRKTFQPPSSPRFFCKDCDKFPEGFQGDHELQRHKSRAHPSVRRTVWICEDRRGDGSFLANCKACMTQKRYWADYNAAAQ